jgi:hypothetical protein
MAKLLVTGDCGQRRCKHCKELYRADVRNRRHQHYCNKQECRRASKKAAQDRWLRSDMGQGYFRGPESVERVRQWRAAHPGYGKRGVSQGALQDVSITQVIDKQGVATVDSSAKTPFPNPLQDLCTSQLALLIGLIASLTGSTLQDDIAETTRRFVHSGQDILGCMR